VGFKTSPYHVYVPAFGDWGYIIISKSDFRPGENYPKNLKFINNEVVRSLFVFPKDQMIASRDVNRLNNQILVRHFEEEWDSYVH
jgi:spermidine synthase